MTAVLLLEIYLPFVRTSVVLGLRNDSDLLRMRIPDILAVAIIIVLLLSEVISSSHAFSAGA